MQELTDLTIAEAGLLLRRRDISPLDLTEAALERIDRLDPHLHAFITVTVSHARVVARQAEQRFAEGKPLGDLDGIPFALKDNIETAGIPTTSQSRTMADHIPDRDAGVAARLSQAGGVLVGKTSMFEFASGGPSPDLPWPAAVNPWSERHQPGGSSSGSAAAVAARLVPAAIGTDTGGSVRWPAAVCGITGLKPTYGRISRRGVHPNAFSLDHCGPMARTAEDCAILLSAIAGHDPLDPGSIDEPVPDYRAALTGSLSGLRVGLVRCWYAADATPEVTAAVDAAVAMLRDLGAAVEEVALPPLADYTDCKTILSMSEIYTAHRTALTTRPQELGTLLRTGIIAGGLIRAEDYLQAQRWRTELASGLLGSFRRFDVLATAGWLTQAEPADTAGVVSFRKRPLITMPFNLAGNPALSLPCGFSAEGLPLAVQIAGKPFDEATVLRVGDAYQRATGWHLRQPVGPVTAR